MKKLLMMLCLLILPLAAELPMIFIDNGSQLAVEGYDVVSYFSQEKPELGVKTYQIDWQGVKWRFLSAENMKKFESNPQAYAPQFGGYCATAVANGKLTGGLPNIWTITDGKLYLFCSHMALQKWQEGGKEVIQLANKNWPMILQKTE